MNLNTLIEFRHGVYQSFKQAKDALFNLGDALASTYEALEDGIIDAKRLSQVFLKHLPLRVPQSLIAVDSTHIARPKARTSEDRSTHYVHKLGRA